MTEDKSQPKALDDDALDSIAGGGMQAATDPMLTTSTSDEPITAAATGTAWAKQFKHVARDIK